MYLSASDNDSEKETNKCHSAFSETLKLFLVSFKSKLLPLALLLADQVISGLLICPLVAAAWWGVWMLLDRHLFPGNDVLIGYVCFTIGNVGLWFLAFTQLLWKKTLKLENICHWIFGYHLNICLCFFFNVCHWRGLWKLLEGHTETSPQNAWTTFAIGQISLLLLRATKNAQTPPMIVGIDRYPELFAYTTRFRTQPCLSFKYVFDVIFTVSIVHQLSVCYWKGLYELMNIYIYPSNRIHSSIGCFVIGYSLMLSLSALQPLFNATYRRYLSDSAYVNFWKWSLEAVVYFFSNIVNVALWRGVWVLFDVFVIHKRQDVVCAVTSGVSVGVLMLMLSSQSLTVRGCDIDGDAPDDDVCICPNKYLRCFWKTGWVESGQKQMNVNQIEKKEEQ